jgi:hypothetical protein
MAEAAIVKRITRWLLRYPDAWVEKRRGGPHRRGMPDMEFIWRGRAFFFEVKVPGESATPLQAFYLDRLAKAGAVTRWRTNLAGRRDGAIN